MAGDIFGAKNLLSIYFSTECKIHQNVPFIRIIAKDFLAKRLGVKSGIYLYYKLDLCLLNPFPSFSSKCNRTLHMTFQRLPGN